jgi:hypothetical protein
MKRCPHCNARLNFFRVLRMTRRTPYKCPRCGGASTARFGRAAFLLYFLCLFAFLIVLTALRDHYHFGVWVAAPVAVIAVPLGFFLLMMSGRFEPQSPQEPSAHESADG